MRLARARRGPPRGGGRSRQYLAQVAPSGLPPGPWHSRRNLGSYRPTWKLELETDFGGKPWSRSPRRVCDLRLGLIALTPMKFKLPAR